MKSLLVKKFLAKLESKYKQVYVAGGFPLAMVVGSPVKDIDVFIIGCPLEIVGSKAGEVLILEGQPCIGKGGSSRYVGSHCWWTVVDGHQLDLVFVDADFKSPEELVQHFDFDICEMYIKDLKTTKWEVVQTSSAKKALKDRYITYKKPDEAGLKVLGAHINKDKREKRIRRYKEKFPGFKMVEEL